jgi:hypothetical protein
MNENPSRSVTGLETLPLEGPTSYRDNLALSTGKTFAHISALGHFR